jgi:hypothetical protein
MGSGHCTKTTTSLHRERRDPTAVPDRLEQGLVGLPIPWLRVRGNGYRRPRQGCDETDVSAGHVRGPGEEGR